MGRWNCWTPNKDPVQLSNDKLAQLQLKQLESRLLGPNVSRRWISGQGRRFTFARVCSSCLFSPFRTARRTERSIDFLFWHGQRQLA